MRLARNLTKAAPTERDERLVTLFALATVLVVVGAYLVFTLSNASYTLGCDYLTYDAAARRWLAGQPTYDLAVTATGTCGIYQYPPSFLVLVLPFTLLTPAAATWAWIAVSLACVGAAVALMPVPTPVKLLTLALAGTSWPLLFAVKVGAAGPLLLLVFAASWRWLDRPARLAGAVAVGALAKLQPGLLVPWMALTGRWRAAILAGSIGLGALAIGFALDARSWLDFFTTVRTLSTSALEVRANFAPASVAWHLFELPETAARSIGIGHTVLVLALVVVSARRSTADASILVAAVASQVLAPVMWDHYALVLFLPMAWLAARGHAWAFGIGLVLNAMFVLWVPPIAYIALLDGTMIAVATVGWRRAAEVNMAVAPASAAT
ncbi:MAG: glycosyltransferase family 87 protein [Candidatus Limnocylindrales bacterium]